MNLLRGVELTGRVRFLLIGILALGVGHFMVAPLLAVYMAVRLHLSPARIGVILAILAITQQGSQVLIGVASDRWGRRPLLSLGVISTCAGYLTLAHPGPFAGQAAAAAALGLGSAAVSLVAKTMLAEEAGADRVAALTLRSVAVNVGAAVGPILGGALFGHFSAALLVAAAVHAAFWLAVVTTGGVTEPTTVARVRLQDHLMGLLANKRLIGLSAASVGFWYLYSQLVFTFPLYGQRRFDLGGQVGLLFAINAAIAVVFQYTTVTRTSRRIDPWQTLGLGAGLLAAAFLILGAVSAIWALVVFVVLFSFGELLIVPTLDVLTVNLAQPGSTAGSLGLASLGWAGGGLLGNLAGGVLYSVAERSGQFGLFWSANGVVGALTAAAFLLQRRHFQADQDDNS